MEVYCQVNFDFESRLAVKSMVIHVVYGRKTNCRLQCLVLPSILGMPEVLLWSFKKSLNDMYSTVTNVSKTARWLASVFFLNQAKEYVWPIWGKHLQGRYFKRIEGPLWYWKHIIILSNYCNNFPYFVLNSNSWSYIQWTVLYAMEMFIERLVQMETFETTTYTFKLSKINNFLPIFVVLGKWNISNKIYEVWWQNPVLIFWIIIYMQPVLKI